MNKLRLTNDFLEVFSGSKDFSRNRVLASHGLNARGLHVWRMQVSAWLTRLRRTWLARRLPAADVALFDAQGFFEVADWLPAEALAAVKAELCEASLPLLEMAQPPALTHRANLDAATCRGRYPALYRLIRHPALQHRLAYAAGHRGEPVIALQIIRSAGAAAGHDPQCDWHRDTFHSTAKAWLFLHEVSLDQGPFAYWPGSQRLTPGRLAWERARSLTAVQDGNLYHRRGSFRVDEEALPAMGYAPVPRVFTVPGNTLIVADTLGFHRRTPSPRPSLRLEIYASLRRSPFWAGIWPAMMDLPWIRRHWAGLDYRRAERLLQQGRPDWIPLGRQRLAEDAACLLLCQSRQDNKG
jgi:hypothetical protein